MCRLRNICSGSILLGILLASTWFLYEDTMGHDAVEIPVSQETNQHQNQEGAQPKPESLGHVGAEQAATQPDPAATSQAESGETQQQLAIVPTQPARPAVHGDVAIEGMSWQDLQAARVNVQYCTRCRQPMEGQAASRSREKKSHQTLKCKTCHNAVTLLYKRWDMSKLNFKDMPQADQLDFFRKVKEMHAGGDKISAGKIRTVLVKKLTEVERNSTETAVKGKFLPLSVYAKKGFDVETIRDKAEQLQSDLFGTVYRVPILEINYSHIEESVRETVLAAERKLKPQKRNLAAPPLRYSPSNWNQTMIKQLCIYKACMVWCLSEAFIFLHVLTFSDIRTKVYVNFFEYITQATCVLRSYHEVYTYSFSALITVHSLVVTKRNYGGNRFIQTYCGI